MGPGPLSSQTKDDLRREALARRDALAPAAWAEAAAAMARHIGALPLPQGPVAAYWPIRSEADPRPAAALLRARGHAIALPCVLPDGLAFRLWQAGDALVAGPFGLREPAPGQAEITPAILLVPLAAFDRRGHRIGYGKGFYDRALAALGPVTTIGLAFALQEIPLIPDEAHDRRLDFVVTEQEIIDTRAG